MQCIFQDSLFFYYSIFCKLCCFHAFFPPRIPGFPEFSLPEFLQRNPEFLRSEPGTYIFRRRNDRGRQSRADLHRLCQCPAIGQACRDARAECSPAPVVSFTCTFWPDRSPSLHLLPHKQRPDRPWSPPWQAHWTPAAALPEYPPSPPASSPL